MKCVELQWKQEACQECSRLTFPADAELAAADITAPVCSAENEKHGEAQKKRKVF